MCSLHSSEPDSPKPLARGRVLMMLNILRWELRTTRQSWKIATKQSNAWTVLTWICLDFFSIPQSAGQETSSPARFSPGSEERGTLRPRSPPRRKKWEVESSGQPEWASLLQFRGGKLLGLLKKPGEGTAATPQRVVRSATFWEYATETDAEEQLTGRQGRSSARVCACRQRETLCLCHCASRPVQRDQDGGKGAFILRHTWPGLFQHTVHLFVCLEIYASIHLPCTYFKFNNLSIACK